MQTLDALRYLAAQSKMAGIDYRKPTEEEATRRHVEPYQLQYSGDNLMALCWQVEPVCRDTPHSWRCFRIDRIIMVYDINKHFKPRTEVTIHTGESNQFVWDEKPVEVAEQCPPEKAVVKAKGAPGSLAAVNQYFEYIESALLDGKADVSEKETAHTMARRLSVDQIRAVHAQVYMNILRECLIDGQIDFREEDYLRKVRRSMKGLGWEP